ncbi:hypothetical protein HRV97_03090 [Sphingomonas sp. HHU CXW]|uniref:Lipoprotein n=1 Tax=Sphingomonas hominis TaxID=2741495 RepID=A0ABX2JD85_9SPHN|nr:hypothetical protein [Sphingomonas hominis]NTS64146.1 hypothetical protein [Sphingomonas hominis]
MKAIVAAGALVALSGCISLGGGKTAVPMPKDAYAAIYSQRPADQVDACLRSAGLPASYQARQLNDNPGPYRSVVAVTTSTSPTDSQVNAYAACTKGDPAVQ